MSAHGANAYLAERILTQNIGAPLTEMESWELTSILRLDARKYYQSGLITYLEAIAGLRKRTWTWSAVKFYYSVFYLIRALLALEGVAYVSVNKKLGWIKTQPGECLAKFPPKKSYFAGGKAEKNLSGSHGSVLYLLEKNFPNSRLLSQEIDGLYPTEWLMKAREFHNYQSCGFSDPKPSQYFDKYVENLDAHARTIYAYFNDKDDLYTFTSDHAVISYPTFVIKHVAGRFEQQSTSHRHKTETRALLPLPEAEAEAEAEAEDIADNQVIMDNSLILEMIAAEGSEMNFLEKLVIKP
ncbi:hypothetical protein [Pseudomonas tremae]|uniref:hypothetical protein n=1 Tax=Pseudomonas tremae TaxID=200454 RepID=UPI0004632099|nr:hypothetical protein [Pseudomonas tremae]